jgi:hypothetical protein
MALSPHERMFSDTVQIFCVMKGKTEH